MTNEAWLEGWAKLRVCFASAEMSKAEKDLRSSAYRDALDDMTDAEWDRAVRAALRKPGTFLPSPGQIREWGADPVSPPVTVGADVYERIVEAFEAGARPDARQVAAKFGVVVRDAFQAAGGVPAFEWCEPRNEPFRRKAFLEAFVTVVTADPELAAPARAALAPAPGAVRLLAAPKAHEELLGLRIAEADRITAMYEVDRTADVPLPSSGNTGHRKLLKLEIERPSTRLNPLNDEQYAARKAELERQRLTLVGGERADG